MPDTPEENGLRSRLLSGCAIVFVIAVAFSWPLFAYWFNPNRFVLEQRAKTPVENVSLEVVDVGGNLLIAESWPRLEPGASILYTHRRTDLRARISFESGGRRQSYRTQYIDLWTGQGWLYEIRDGGVVFEGYDEHRTLYPAEISPP